MSTNFRNTVAADVTLAANVNASTRYRTMGRLNVGSVVGASRESKSSLQASHEAKTEYRSTNYGHDPMNSSGSRPPVPTAEFVSSQTPSG